MRNPEPTFLKGTDSCKSLYIPYWKLQEGGYNQTWSTFMITNGWEASSRSCKGRAMFIRCSFIVHGPCVVFWPWFKHGSSTRRNNQEPLAKLSNTVIFDNCLLFILSSTFTILLTNCMYVHVTVFYNQIKRWHWHFLSYSLNHDISMRYVDKIIWNYSGSFPIARRVLLLITCTTYSPPSHVASNSIHILQMLI